MQDVSTYTPDTERIGRRTGYVVAIAVNAAMLYVIVNLVDWGWFAFITEEFDRIVPWVGASLLVTIVVNGTHLINDDEVPHRSAEIIGNLTSVVATIQVYRVFPFDFSGSQFDWEIVARVVLVLAIVGSFVAAVNEAVKLVRHRNSVA